MSATRPIIAVHSLPPTPYEAVSVRIHRGNPETDDYHLVIGRLDDETACGAYTFDELKKLSALMLEALLIAAIEKTSLAHN